MKIEINLKILLFLLLFFLLKNIDTYLIFLVFVIIHELAHLFWGILIGGKPRKLYLNPLGVSLEFYTYGKNNSLNKICFLAIGPITNLVIAILFYYFYEHSQYKFKIVFTNLALCLFNLIPIVPLDGGKILREGLKSIIGIEKANKITIVLSKIILVILSLIYSVLILKVKSI